MHDTKTGVLSPLLVVYPRILIVFGPYCPISHIAVHRCGPFLEVACSSVSVLGSWELCKNGWTNRGTVWEATQLNSRNLLLDRVKTFRREGVLLWGQVPALCGCVAAMPAFAKLLWTLVLGLLLMKSKSLLPVKYVVLHRLSDDKKLKITLHNIILK